LAVIQIGLAVLFASTLVAIGDFLKYCGCLKYNVCSWLSCTCCCTEGCSIYAQLIFWLSLFAATTFFVEDCVEDSYMLESFTNSQPVADYGYSRAVIGMAVEDKCGVDGFLWIDYHIDDIPDIVESRDYEIITSIGLAFSIIEFAIGIALVHCTKKKPKKKSKKKESESVDNQDEKVGFIRRK